MVVLLCCISERNEYKLLRSLFRNRQYGGHGIERKSMRREIVSITWPAFIELVMSTLFGMVDMIMVGQISSAAIASIGLTNQPFMMLNAIFAAVNVGTTTVVAWNIGAGNREKAASVAKQVIVVNIVLGILMSIIGFSFARQVVTFMGANEDTMEYATIYFQIIAAGMMFQAVTMAITAALRGAGETKLPMVYNLGANLLNVFGNYVLIYGALGFPRWGVAGAAVSTTLSRVIACGVALYIIFSGKSAISVSLKDGYKPDFSIIKQVFSIGFPASVEQFIMQSGLMMFARTVSGLGTSEFAAHQIGLNINGLTFSPSMAFGVAATALVGQSLGANDEEKAEKYANTAHRMAMFVSCFVGLTFILFSYPMARLYTNEPDVAAKAGTVLKIVALAQFGVSTQVTVGGALRGAGDTMYPLYASAIGIWVFRVFFAYVFVNIFKWGLIGAWVALVLDQSTRAVVVYLRYCSGKWKYIKSRTAETKNTQTACS
jgi:putative MATE family efflux protein